MVNTPDISDSESNSGRGKNKNYKYTPLNNDPLLNEIAEIRQLEDVGFLEPGTADRVYREHLEKRKVKQPK